MILHVDMDAFYASIEERDNPALAGRPLIVGGTPSGRGVVAAANYEVRRFGVHSAMPTSKALRLCAQAIVLPCRMDHYARVSHEIQAIFERYTPLVEPLSLDEAFLDVTGSRQLFGPAAQIGRRIKDEIRRELRLVASVGVAPNKFLAKVASDLEKPDGFVVVEPDRVAQFLDPLPVGRLWGVGRVTGQAFEELGIRTIGQLRALPAELLEERFGKWGEQMWRLAQGIDGRRVVPDHQAKSISHETTFPADIDEAEALRAWLLELTEQVGCRLRRHRLRARTVHIKVRFADFRTVTGSETLAEPTDITAELWQAAAGLLTEKLPAGHQPLRLLGMGASHLDHAGPLQRRLFDEPERLKQSRLDAVADLIRARLGQSALGRASGLRKDAGEG